MQLMLFKYFNGKYGSTDVYIGDDVRRVITRFSRKNMEANTPLLMLLHRVSREKSASPAQISLAWMLHKWDFLSPIPGMRRIERLKENFGAADVIFTDREFGCFEEELAGIEIYGNRTDEDIARLKEMI